MPLKLLYGMVLDPPRRVIHVVRAADKILDFSEIDEITGKMRAYTLSKTGEQDPNIVIVHGNSRETLRLIGDTHAVTRVRAALFNVAVTFSPLKLEVAD